MGVGEDQGRNSVFIFGKPRIIPSQALCVKIRVSLGPSSPKVYSGTISCSSECFIPDWFLAPKPKV